MPRLSNNTNIPTAVSKIRLCSALSNCGHIGVQEAMDIVKPKCNQMGVELEEKVDIDAYIVFDNELNVTAVKATFQAIAMDVLEEEKLLLYFDNKKTFE